MSLTSEREIQYSKLVLKIFEGEQVLVASERGNLEFVGNSWREFSAQKNQYGDSGTRSDLHHRTIDSMQKEVRGFYRKRNIFY